ncbi:GDSL-type esterase/lipase family protein [Dactylosporangium sp. NPDC049742]|uniref:GDSL-type esterase/lipase family protein n=1 Tax=Dactylosporangium sp. NPDC049742 TaxID=3154737 RepID=UPI0034398DEC
MATFRSLRRRAALCGAALATAAGVVTSTPQAQAADTPAAGGTYTIAANQCLTTGASCTGQQWRVEARGTRFGLVDTATGRCLAGTGGITTALTAVTCSASAPDQQWSFVAKSGAYQLKNGKSGWCARAASPAALDACTGDANRLWTFTKAGAAAHVYVAGDSTASIYTTKEAPRAGWGQALPAFAGPNTTIVDAAWSGASSKSFIDGGRLTWILARIQPGDHLIISFGHNDEKTDDPARGTDPQTTFKSYLTQYIDKSRAKGARPVLVTPVERRRFNAAGAAQPSHGAYPQAMRELAAAKNVPLVDLTAASLALWNQQGVDGTRQSFMTLPAGQYPNYPNGIEDNTHFQARGAIEVARLVATALDNQGLPGAGAWQKLTSTIPTTAVIWPATAPTY